MTIQGDEVQKAEHAELVERVRRFVAEEVAPRAASIDRENAFPTHVYRRMGEEGLLDLARPQGAGKTTLERAVWIEELAAASATVADPDLRGHKADTARGPRQASARMMSPIEKGLGAARL